MVYLGSAIFKIARLLIVATSCVHLFACAFHRVKVESAYSPEDVTAFYSSRGIENSVRFPREKLYLLAIKWDINMHIVFGPNLIYNVFDFLDLATWILWGFQVIVWLLCASCIGNHVLMSWFLIFFKDRELPIFFSYLTGWFLVCRISVDNM